MSKQLSIAIVRTDNSVDLGHYDADLRSLQQIVGGYIEVVNLDNPEIIMIGNEEAKLTAEPKLNSIATMIYELCWGFGHDYIAGDVIMCGQNGEDFGDLTEKGFELITQAVDECRQRARI